jgi:hypothetical protein
MHLPPDFLAREDSWRQPWMRIVDVVLVVTLIVLQARFGQFLARAFVKPAKHGEVSSFWQLWLPPTPSRWILWLSSIGYFILCVRHPPLGLPVPDALACWGLNAGCVIRYWLE